MNKNPILKKILKYTFLTSGFIPAHYLLFWAIYLLFGPFIFGEIENIRFDKEVITFYGSLIIGIFGYLGLLLSLIPKFENKYIIKISFLILGIIGFTIFSIQGDNGFDGFLKSFYTHIFTFDWFLFYWPNMVSLVLIVYFLFKELTQK